MLITIIFLTSCFLGDNNFIFTTTYTLYILKGSQQYVVIFCEKNGKLQKTKYFQIQPKQCPEQLLGRGLPGSPSCPRMLCQEPASWQPVIPNSCLLSAKRSFFEVPGKPNCQEAILGQWEAPRRGSRRATCQIQESSQTIFFSQKQHSDL